MNYYKISRFFLFLIPLSIVVVSTGTLFPFIVGKYAVFRATTDLALIFFLLGVIFDSAEWPAVKERIIKVFKNPLTIAISIFVVAFLLACFFGYDPAASFWANFERGEGGLQVLTLYAFFLLTLFLFRKEEDWKKFLKISLVAAGLMILYGVLAGLNIQGFIGVPLNFGNRFEGSLGNPAYVAPYLVFSIFFALYFFLTSKSRNVKISMVGLSAIFLLFFVMSQTRGAFLGLAAGIGVFLVYLIFSLGGQWRKWGSVVLIVLVLGTGTLAFFSRTHFVENLPGGRLFQISLSDSSAQTRLWTWGSALQGAKERPIFGWGPENFAVVFDKFINPRHFIPGQHSETWFDRAHDVYIDYLTETGLVGLLSYLGIFVTFFILLFKKLYPKRSDHQDPKSRTPHVILVGLFLAVIVQYLVQGVALFDVLPIFIPLYTTLAFFTFKVMERKTTNH
jgi:O-antigen ligase